MNKLKQLFRQQIAEELLRIRKEKGLSLTDVALQTDLSLMTIQNIENNFGTYNIKKIHPPYPFLRQEDKNQFGIKNSIKKISVVFML